MKDKKILKNIFISPLATVKDALKRLSKTAEKVLLVVDEGDVLLGTITDGDVRNYLLKGGKIASSIEKVYNPNPTYLNDVDIERAKELMLLKKIELIPVVDEHKRVKDYFSWAEIFAESMGVTHGRVLDVPTVIMAGGKGTRLEPLTKILPKPLIPVGDKPIVDIIINEFRKCGVSKFYMTLNYKSELIKAYFGGYKKDLTIEFVKEKDFLGTAGSLKMLEDRIEDVFIVSNCDVVVKADYEDVVRFHKKQRAELTILSSIQHYKIPYGVIEFKNGGRVARLIEKPEYVFTVNTGVYILNRSVLKHIPENSFFDMTELIQSLIKSKNRVTTYPVNEDDYIDIGQWTEYKRNKEFLENI